MHRIINKGFTLIELIVVMSIVAFTSVAIGSGILNLQAIVKTDNAIRDIKKLIQTTQTTSRTSFLAGSSNTMANNNQISLGWLIEFRNEDPRTIRIVRRSIYFLSPNSYDLKNLRHDIDQFVTRLQNSVSTGVLPYCNSNVFLVGNVPLQGQNGFLLSGNIRVDVLCATSTVPNDYFVTDIKSIQFIEPSGLEASITNPAESCFYNSSGGAIFFATGYAKPVLSRNQDCQLIIQSVGVVNQYRALRVSRINGSVSICGTYCPR
ncbi:MAG: hypothetical protein KatS3mg084_0204 [Candidatus Dojkabacteria bacterium]|nr:MAG: hypothetical protein KatS3mg084_0204 [Candidatus Dojkabacteria bacterium]